MDIGLSFKVSPHHWTLARGPCRGNVGCSDVTRWHFRREFPCVTSLSNRAMRIRSNPASHRQELCGCMGSCRGETRNEELGQADVSVGRVSPKTCLFFVLLGGSRWPQTISGTDTQPTAEPFFLCASVSCLQKSLCMFQTVWVSSPGSWALREPDCHRDGKPTSWKCGFVRTIIQVGPSSSLVQTHSFSVLTSVCLWSFCSPIPAGHESLAAFGAEE